MFSGYFDTRNKKIEIKDTERMKASHIEALIYSYASVYTKLNGRENELRISKVISLSRKALEYRHTCTRAPNEQSALLMM